MGTRVTAGIPEPLGITKQVVSVGQCRSGQCHEVITGRYWRVGGWCHAYQDDSGCAVVLVPPVAAARRLRPPRAALSELPTPSHQASANPSRSRLGSVDRAATPRAT